MGRKGQIPHNKGKIKLDLEPFREQITELGKEMGIAEISENLNLKYMSVYRFIRRNNIPVNTERKRGRELISKHRSMFPTLSPEEMATLYADGFTMREIAAKAITSWPQVKKVFTEHGIQIRSKKEIGKAFMTEVRRQQLSQLAHDGKIGIHRPGARRNTKPERQFRHWAESNDILITEQFQIRKGHHRYDFLLNDTKIIVEVDGIFWHSSPEQKEKDRRHTREAEQHGYTMVRFTDEEIDNSKGSCFNKLKEMI